MASITILTKPELLQALNYAPQQYWPPRPTRQNKSILVEAVTRAHYSPAADRLRAKLACLWHKRRLAGLPVIAKKKV